MKKIILILLIIFTTGCSTYEMRGEQSKYGYVFPATRTDIKIISSDMRTGIFSDNSFAIKTLFVLDIPFSLITDIIIFPYDIILIATDNDDKEDLFE